MTFKYFIIRFVIGIILFVSPFGWTQEYEVEVTMDQTDSTVVFFAKNKSEIRQQVTLNLTQQNLRGYNGPVTMLVPAGESLPMITLTFITQEPWSVSTNYSYIAKPTEEEKIRRQAQLKMELLESLDTGNNPVIVFYGEGCARSEYARDYLEKKKIPFKYIETSNNEHYNKIMFHLIRMQDPETQRIQYPVILANDSISYDIANLRWYLKELAVQYK
ncbi:MAG: hypothetical protein HKO75_09565 [Flavobacteriaceae bacterium]|nr:hypothetical protein [Muriicola sp.]NNL40096.1 hypothetical protein [Flavobacteriaceae bacterium]